MSHDVLPGVLILLASAVGVLGLGGAQVGGSVVLGACAAAAAGTSWREGVIVGGVIAMSSTAIVSRALAERMQLHSDYGRLVMGVLLFQDLAVIPLLVLIPALALSSGEIAFTIGVALA